MLDMLPLWYQYSLVFLFGLIIGSFLNVVIYRFHTGKSLTGSSHCLSCGERLMWFELVPLFSYLSLRGRCRSCGSYIPARYFLVELTAACWFVLVYLQFGFSIMGLFAAVFGLLLLMITVYDLYHMVIPNELVLAVSIGAAMYLLLVFSSGFSWQLLVQHLLAGMGAFAFYGGLWFVSKGRWIGFGDAKLALPLGIILGPLGTFSFVVLSFWVGAVVSLAILAYPALTQLFAHMMQQVAQLWRTCPQGRVVNYGRYFTMKSEVPFAPFMVIAFLLVYMFHADVLSLMAIAI